MPSTDLSKIVAQVVSPEGASVTLYATGSVEFNDRFPKDPIARSMVSMLITQVGLLAPIDKRLNEWFGSTEWKALKDASKQYRSFARSFNKITADDKQVFTATKCLSAGSEMSAVQSITRTERQSLVPATESIEGRSILATK